MAVAELLKIPEEVLEHAAPSVAEFTAVYKSIKKGSAIRHGTDFGSHKKMDKMVWCMGEALRASHRDFCIIVKLSTLCGMKDIDGCSFNFVLAKRMARFARVYLASLG